MAKNSATQIEQDQKKITDEILKNANKSINEIAKKCGFSRQKVWRLIKNMEKNNTIWGYVTVIDPEKINKKRYVMLMKRKNKPIPKEIANQISNREIEKIVKKWGVEFINSTYLNGKFDYLISFDANDLKEAINVVELYRKLYTGFISEIELHEEIFPVKKDGINNPEINKINDFFNAK